MIIIGLNRCMYNFKGKRGGDGFFPFASLKGQNDGLALTFIPVCPIISPINIAIAKEVLLCFTPPDGKPI
jgi:hypothetical protein